MGKFTYSGRLLREFVAFARERRTYWIVPLVLLLGLAAFLGLLVASEAMTPLIYTLF